MRLQSARVVGFQSFSDTGLVEFSDGINLIIGQNNSGKSALLRALLPALPDDRYRSPERWETFRLPLPRCDLVIQASGPELRDWTLRFGEQQHIPMPPEERDVRAFVDAFFSRSSVRVAVSRTANSEFNPVSYPSHNLFKSDRGPRGAQITPRNGELELSDVNSGADSLARLAWRAWNQEMFYFAAERMTIGECGHGYANRLLPNASNLPIVLHALDNERRDIFQLLIRHIREIFPTVGNLTVRTRPENNYLEVRVWPTEAMQRVELSFPLNASGTGVSQVIALLTAIMTLENAVVIVDEINSFLHPAAVKALLRILQTHYAHHQYIISTHAPEVIGFSNPSTIHLIRRKGYASSVQRLDLKKLSTFREVAEHLGVSMADVFAADQVIWVEGQTEELCFPYLYQKFGNSLPRGTVFTSVAATGDFQTNKRTTALVFEVYQRLSAATASLVVSVAFSFDSEKLTSEEKAKLRKESRNLVHFLPRRNIECYLLEPAAIADFIVSKDPQSAGGVDAAKVEAALKVAANERPIHIREWKGDINDVDWLSAVDGASLIELVCASLSDQRAAFSKKNDTLFLMQSILGRNPPFLEPLHAYVASLIAAMPLKES